MRKYIDAIDKKNEIRLLFKHPLYKDKFIVIVEGISDIKLFRKLIETPKIKLESIDGKKNLIKVMKDLHTELPDRLLGICDADQEHIIENSEDREQYAVYITDLHDAEMMMLASPALNSFINEYTKSELLDETREEILHQTISSANTIGLLRWLNEELSLNLKFKGLNYSEFCHPDHLSVKVDKNKLVEILLRRSPKTPEFSTKEYILDAFEEFSKRSACKFQVCCGHDATNIISMIYRQNHLSLETNMDQKKVETALRIGYSLESFRQTKLSSNLEKAINLSTLNRTASESAA